MLKFIGYGFKEQIVLNCFDKVSNKMKVIKQVFFFEKYKKL